MAEISIGLLASDEFTVLTSRGKHCHEAECPDNVARTQHDPP